MGGNCGTEGSGLGSDGGNDFFCCAAVAYGRLAPSRSAAKLAAKLAWGGPLAEVDIASETEQVADEPEPIRANAWLAHILRSVLSELPSTSFAEQVSAAPRPIIVGLVDDSSVISSARTYDDGSSLILVPLGGMKLCVSMATCCAFLVSQAVRPTGWIRRVLKRQVNGLDVAAVAAAAIMTDLEQVRRFYVPKAEPRFAPPIPVSRQTLTAMSLVQAAMRAVLIIKRTEDEIQPVPLVADEDDELEICQVALGFILGHEAAHVLCGDNDLGFPPPQ